MISGESSKDWDGVWTGLYLLICEDLELGVLNC